MIQALICLQYYVPLANQFHWPVCSFAFLYVTPSSVSQFSAVLAVQLHFWLVHIFP